MTRNGKIARQPKHIRDQLSRRLENNEPAGKILKWLNGRSDVQEILKEQFGGQPINEANLTAWRQGGHQEWLRRREACDKLRCLSERAEDLDEAVEGQEISDCLGSIAAAELADLAVKLLEEATDPRERWRLLQEILRALRHLRHEDHIGQRIHLEREKWEREVERQDEEGLERMKEEHKKRMTGMFFSEMQRPAMAKTFGGGKNGEILAEYLHRIEFGLPLEGLIDDTPLKRKTPPSPVEPDKAELSSIKPNKGDSAKDHTASDNHETPP